MSRKGLAGAHGVSASLLDERAAEAVSRFSGDEDGALAADLLVNW